MKHLQLKLNLDNTICIDYYDSEMYSSDIVNTLKSTIESLGKREKKDRRFFFFKKKKNKTNSEKKIVRRFPFSITQCEHCGHLILTNRDYCDEIKCQNCNTSFLFQPVINDMNRTLLSQIHDALGYNLSTGKGFTVYMLLIVPKDTNSAIAHKLLTMFGFAPSQCEGDIYDNLVKISHAQGWMSPGCCVSMSQLLLSDDDCFLDETIPRVEACARAIDKYTVHKAKTVSTHISNQAQHERTRYDGRASILLHIEKLTAEGRLEEAAELLDNL